MVNTNTLNFLFLKIKKIVINFLIFKNFFFQK